MKAANIMTENVVTITADTPIKDIARKLLENRISGMPVVDDQQKVIGIVSEGDLVRRVENDTVHRNSSWLESIFSTRNLPEEFIKSHGKTAKDVMSDKVITVGEDAPLKEISNLLEGHNIKRLPVVQNGKLVGIVSRANLIQAIASMSNVPESKAWASDQEIRKQIYRKFEEAGVGPMWLNVIVEDGHVRLWGMTDNDRERDAAVVAAESVAGVKSVEANLGQVPAYIWAE